MSHTTHVLSVFVPVGNKTTTPKMILESIPTAVCKPKTNVTVITSVYEYLDVIAVRDLIKQRDEKPSTLLITNTEVFSCGHHYSPEKYAEMVKKVFQGSSTFTIIDTNPANKKTERSRTTEKNECKICFTHDGNVINLVNMSVKYVNELADDNQQLGHVDDKVATYIGSRLTVVNDRVEEPAPTVVESSADDSNDAPVCSVDAGDTVVFNPLDTAVGSLTIKVNHPSTIMVNGKALDTPATVVPLSEPTKLDGFSSDVPPQISGDESILLAKVDKYLGDINGSSEGLVINSAPMKWCDGCEAYH